MENTDLSFEYSDVEADIKGHILSVKNPKSGIINADSVGEIILEDAVMECKGKVVTNKIPHVKNLQYNDTNCVFMGRKL